MQALFLSFKGKCLIAAGHTVSELKKKGLSSEWRHYTATTHQAYALLLPAFGDKRSSS